MYFGRGVRPSPTSTGNNMNIDELEEILASYKITKSTQKCQELENKSIPFMLTTFRELIKNEVPPTQQEFISFFKTKYPDLKLKGIISRLKRSYLSYVREHHLGFLLNKHFKKVVYNEKLDLLGIDYVVYYKKRKFNIHAFVNTEGGRYWREIKNDRHKFYGIHLDMPMDLNSGKRVGKIILYNDSHILKLKSEMDNIIRKQIDKSRSLDRKNSSKN